MDNESYLHLAEKSAREAGIMLGSAYSQDAGVVSAGGKDIKTEADLAAEKVVLSALVSTGLPILSEESAETVSRGLASSILDESTLTWIVDPLDGTFNFTRGFPMCCVSIGLWCGKEPVLGVIYDFVGDMMYSGLVGKGATCNGERMQVSSVADPSQAALATGFPSARDYGDAALAESIRRVQRFKKIRMIGSAATSLAHVAAGHVDAYKEEDIWLWDVAAGLALVKAAGGDFQVSDLKDSWQLDVFASNGVLEDTTT